MALSDLELLPQALNGAAVPIVPTPPEDFDMSDMQQGMFSRYGLGSEGQQPDIVEGVHTMHTPGPPPEMGLSAPIEEDWITKFHRWADPSGAINIAAELDESELAGIAMRVIEEARIDDDSRDEWLQAAKKGLDLAMQKARISNYPWPSSSSVVYPLITQAADQFAARAYPAIVANRNVVKGSVIGDDKGVKKPADPMSAMMGHNGGPPVDEWLIEPGAKAARAKRIGDHMSYQFLEEMPEWEEETDKLINILPIAGCVFRKTFWCPVDQRIKSLLVQPENLIVNYWAKSMETAPRITEKIKLYPYEVEENKNSGFFLDVDYGISTEANNDRDAPVEFYEQHRRLDLDKDGYAEPYIVTVAKDSMKVARIVARWEQKRSFKVNPDRSVRKIEPTHYYTKYDFMPNKEGGIYGHGFAHNLRTLNEAINTTLNMLIDAGHLQNTGGGFIGKGLGMMSGQVKFSPGEYKVVNSAGQDIRNSIVMMEHAGPSPVLLTLLGNLIEAGKDISSVKDVMTGEVRAQTMSPTVFMAMVEQGLKVFTAIYKRVHRALRAEFQKVYRLNRLHLDEKAEFKVGEEWLTVTRADYEEGAAVIPFSDPSMVVDAQKMARTDVLAQFKDDPLMNGKAIRKRILEAATIENPEEVMETEPAPNPDLLLQLAEMERKRLIDKADFMVKVTQALKNMADADSKVNEPFQNWAAMQMQGLQNEYERNESQSEPADGPEGPGGGEGADPGPMGDMAAPPDDQGATPLPGGLPGQPA